MRWSVTRLSAAGSLGVLRLVLSMFGGIIVGMTGIPGSSGVITVLVGGIMFVFCCLLLREFGAATIMALVYGVLALPLPVGGAPGFLPKIAIQFSAGLFVDCLFALLRRNEKMAGLIIGGTVPILQGFELMWLGKAFSLPGIERFYSLFFSPTMIAATFAVGSFAGYVGWLAFDRLRDTPLVTRIQKAKPGR